VSILSTELRLGVLAALVDGNSERAVERMTSVSRPTISRLALRFGQGAAWLHNTLAHDLQISDVQVDEIWSYVGKKQARVTPAEEAVGFGDAYTFTALGTASRFVPAWFVGKRDQVSADAFTRDLRARLVVMPAMTSDGFAPYVSAIGASFGPGVDYAQTIKNYRTGSKRGPDHRYEPPRDPFITKRAIFGAPNLDRASTAYMERNNGTMRHFIGRMRRLVYAFSKDLDHHKAAVALGYVHYNLCHIVRTLRVTPAMAAHATDHVWELPELLDALLSTPETAAPIAGPLAHRVPVGTARELPGGRGFLRVVGGTASPVAPSPAPMPPPVAPVAKLVASSGVAMAESTGQLDLLAWRPNVEPPKPEAAPPRRLPAGQLDLFGLDIEPKPTK
jgi:IS1 family transposase